MTKTRNGETRPQSINLLNPPQPFPQQRLMAASNRASPSMGRYHPFWCPRVQHGPVPLGRICGHHASGGPPAARLSCSLA